MKIFLSLVVFFLIAVSIAFYIVSIGIIAWSFGVSFLYGIVAVVFLEIMPLVIIACLIAQA